jgi:SpoVK/Ycf46/Vps4 family AAA+-type ATPase
MDTGKTMLAKAIAKILRNTGSHRSGDIGGAFISLSSTDIVRAEVGTSEKLVLSAFQTARANSPAVIFIDEFQALFTERSRGGSGRLSTTLLQCMDDLNQWKEVGRQGQTDPVENEVRVLVLAATNTPWMIDTSFLRSGRFDRSVHVGLPDLDERKTILRLYVQRMKTDIDASAGGVDAFCDDIARIIDGFSGADISALCRAATMECLLEQAQCVTEKHFHEVLSSGFKASSCKSLVERIKLWRP